MSSATIHPATTESSAPEFDPGRARFYAPDLFPRFRVDEDGAPLSSLRLRPGTTLIIVQRGGQRRAFERTQLAYRHIAQGQLAGQPYVVAFCPACNIAIGLTPVVDGRVHLFSLGGIHDGMMLMIDEETQTYWDYVRGTAVHGALEGEKIDIWGVEMTSVKEALREEPELRVCLCPSPLVGKLFGFASRYLDHWMPPGFRKTIGKLDRRRPKMELGLGIITPGHNRFYPLRAIKRQTVAELGGRALIVTIGDSGIPSAKWVDGGSPFQVFTRWYGFSCSFPNCDIFERNSQTPTSGFPGTER